MPADIQDNSVQCYSTVQNGVWEYCFLAKVVCNYPYLYDKCSDDFKNTNEKKLCWKDVAEAVGVSTGNNLQQQQLYYDSHIYKWALR